MIQFLMQFEPWQQALIGTLFTWGLTALGSALVFFFKDINRDVFNLMLGFASGVMIAASFWSLLDPALDMAEANGSIPWLVVGIGFAVGGLFLYLADKLLPHMHFGENHEVEGLPSNLRRTILLVFSITLHNIPEGLAVGVAFGAANQVSGSPEAGIAAALAVAIGIGIQNFPEGAAVSIPLRQEGLSRTKAFLYGQASGIVEPIAGVIGAILVTYVSSVLPYALAFAAGAMIYVVVEELIPEAQQKQTAKGAHYATVGVMVGFLIMMILDVALG
ncbi:ZIP family metal transporter [Carnobacterium sp.]|uniref:ZIP family metal transporter n=1 Tax=Carnobacterium sp. TaxID=48221 RepID=UPI002FCC7F9F